MSKEEIVLTWFKSCNYKSGTAKAQSLHGKIQGFVKNCTNFQIVHEFFNYKNYYTLWTFYTKPFIHSVVLHCVTQLPTLLNVLLTYCAMLPAHFVSSFIVKEGNVALYLQTIQCFFQLWMPINSNYIWFFKHNYLL